MASRCLLGPLLLISIGSMMLTALQASAAEPLEVFAGQDKLGRLGVALDIRDAKLVGPDPPDPLKTYSFSWDFDASQDIDQNGIYDDDNESAKLPAQHVYRLEGNFTATLTVTDSTGGTAKDTFKVRIVDDIPPLAQIVSISPNPATQGDSVVFTGSGVDLDGIIVEYGWTYRLASSGYNDFWFPSKGPTFNTSSLSPGNYTIKLSVLDDKGFWSEPATAGLNVKVKPNLPFTLTVLTTRSRMDVGTEIDLVVRYTDPEGDIPWSTHVYFGSSKNIKMGLLVQVDKADWNYIDGKDYHFSARLNVSGSYTYYFEVTNLKNGRQVTDKRYIEVKESKGFVPGMEWVSAVTVLLLAVGARKALPAHGRPLHRDAPRSAPDDPPTLPLGRP